jgi:UDP-glucose 4-epimerase
MRKILVTGYKGYIGQHLCKMLEQIGGIEVIGIDKVDNIVDITYNVPEIEVDTVIHLAALVKVGESVDKPTIYYNTNINGTNNVLSKVKYKHFIFASTGAAENPGSPYGLSKRAAEDIVKEYARVNKTDYTIFRFYNVIGSDGFEPTNPDGLFYNLVKAEERGYINLYGDDYDTFDGTCIREYIHVNDICLGIINAIGNPANNIENLAYGDPRSVKQNIETYKKVNKSEFDVKILPKRDGDLAETYLKTPSKYMECNYSYETMLKIR